jgi:tRNA threonylcarbamoyl adenosine modification protein (Sua5/YciO/YrdC/YwlC family)
MAQIFSIHPDNPQPRLIGQAVAILRHGGVVAYPTDSCYALGCLPGEKDAMDKILRIRRLAPGHYMTLLCRDLSDTGNLARVDNNSFRLLKSLTPGPYTFVLKANREVPRRLQDSKAKTIGLRVPDNTIVLALLQALGEPLLSTSLILPGEDLPETDPREIDRKIGGFIDLVIEGGEAGQEQTTIIDLTGEEPQIIRKGKGDITRITD